MNRALVALIVLVTLGALCGCEAIPPGKEPQTACDCEGSRVCDLAFEACGANAEVKHTLGDVVENDRYEGGKNNIVGPR